MYQCPEGEYCGMPITKGMSLKDDGVYNLELVSFGIIHFDDIVFAMVTIV